MSDRRVAVRARVAPPLSGPSEAALREQGRREALDEADRTMLATLITLDRRQQAQGEVLIGIAARLDSLDRRVGQLVAALTRPPASEPVDPLARTVAAVEESHEVDR